MKKRRVQRRTRSNEGEIRISKWHASLQVSCKWYILRSDAEQRSNRIVIEETKCASVSSVSSGGFNLGLVSNVECQRNWEPSASRVHCPWVMCVAGTESNDRRERERERRADGRVAVVVVKNEEYEMRRRRQGRRWAIIREKKGAQARLTRRPRDHPRRTANRDNTHSIPSTSLT